MKKDNKKALYESIMTSVAREVKKALNESEFENLKFSPLIAKGLNYIKSNESMYNYFKNANIESIEQSDEIVSVCITPPPYKIFFNKELIDTLSDQEQAYVILFCCAAAFKFKNIRYIGYEDACRMNRKINNNLVYKWPEFEHIPQKLHLQY